MTELAQSRQEQRAADLYLELLKQTLTRSLFDQVLVPVYDKRRASLRSFVFTPIRTLLARRGLTLAQSLAASDVFTESPPVEIRTADTLIGPVGIDSQAMHRRRASKERAGRFHRSRRLAGWGDDLHAWCAGSARR